MATPPSGQSMKRAFQPNENNRETVVVTPTPTKREHTCLKDAMKCLAVPLVMASGAAGSVAGVVIAFCSGECCCSECCPGDGRL